MCRTGYEDGHYIGNSQSRSRHQRCAETNKKTEILIRSDCRRSNLQYSVTNYHLTERYNTVIQTQSAINKFFVF